MSSRTCKDCGMCCLLPAIPELDKPAQTWCSHCTKTNGCRIHETKPDVCKTFSCMYLWNNNFPEELKPNKSKVMFSATAANDAIQVFVHPHYPKAIEKPMVVNLIERFRRQGLHIIIITGKERKFMNGYGTSLPPEITQMIEEEKPWTKDDL